MDRCTALRDPETSARSFAPAMRSRRRLILVDDCADPFSVESVRASMGALFTQRIAMARWDEFLAWLRSGEGELIGTSLDTSTDYQSVRYRKPAFILVGNEQAGLPQAYESECDLLVKIPMLGRADSLNAAVATAVMAYSWSIKAEVKRMEPAGRDASWGHDTVQSYHAAMAGLSCLPRRAACALRDDDAPSDRRRLSALARNRPEPDDRSRPAALCRRLWQTMIVGPTEPSRPLMASLSEPTPAVDVIQRVATIR